MLFFDSYSPKMRKTDITDFRRWLEIAAVVSTGVMKYIFMDWLNLRVFYIGAASLLWAVYIYKRYRENPLILREWGFRYENLKPSFLFILPFTLSIITAIILYGYYSHAIFLNWHVIPVLAIYPVWGIVQQFLTLALVAGNLLAITSVKPNKNQIILFISVLFALVHYPSLPLIIFTFFMEMVFAIAYFRWRNLWPLALCHGWVASLLLFFVLGRDLWDELWPIF